ncbi:MAG: methyltransferase domain-containing protein, partial [Pseudomonadota bacterium]
MNIDKTGSYISALDYVSGYFKDISIHTLRNLMLMYGHYPPPIDGNYLELGIGQGTSVVAHAKMSEGKFYGCDLYPSHIIKAKEFAHHMDADLTLLNNSFEELLLREDIPTFDYIACHGVWSWVSEDVKQQICSIVEKFLNPGGIFYCSFNNIAGWANFVPVLQFIQHYVKKRNLDVHANPELFGEVLDALDELISFDSNLAKDERVKSMIKDMRQRNKIYLIHEYLVPSWRATSLPEFASYMQNIRMDYLGPAKFGLFKSRQHIGLLPKGLEFNDDPIYMQNLHDITSKATLSAELFVRGRRKITEHELLAEVQNYKFVFDGAELKKPKNTILQVDGLDMETEFINPLLELVAEDNFRPKKYSEILNKVPACRKMPSVSDFLQAIYLSCNIMPAAQGARQAE